jgi:acyl-CoA dehydrogenase
MNDVAVALGEAVTMICERHGTLSAEPALDVALWAALEDGEMTLAPIAQECGGGGADLEATGAIVRAVARYGARVPIAETALLAGWLYELCDHTVPKGPLTAAVDGTLVLRPHGDGWHVSGELRRVPWARATTQVLALAPGGDGGAVVVLRPSDVALIPGANLANEPRDDLAVDVDLPLDAVMEPGRPLDALRRDLEQRIALARLHGIVGAAERTLALVTEYVADRRQFGRPIGSFQAVQHRLAGMACDVVAVRAVADAATRAVTDARDAEVAVAAAKAYASAAAGRIASGGHQLHGAVGFTDEHPLHHATSRLWAWRDEGGSGAAWSRRLGARALREEGVGLWPLITGGSAA